MKTKATLCVIGATNYFDVYAFCDGRIRARPIGITNRAEIRRYSLRKWDYINRQTPRRRWIEPILYAQEENYSTTKDPPSSGTGDEHQTTPKNHNKKATSSQKATPQEKLTDVDARVLQSILQDENLDFQTEKNLKELLKRGTAPAPAPRAESVGSKNEEKTSYSSTFFKTLEKMDDAFWNSVRAKSEEILESTKIFLANRIERDAKLLASVGIFAWQRAVRDVGRALPASGRSSAGVAEKMRSALFRLSSNSSFVPYVPEDNFILGPSKYDKDANLYDELNTPMDEIRSVTESIRDIVSGKGVTAYSSESRGLKSVAPAGSSRNSERQRRAFERRKETVLKREKEGIDAKLGRAASTVTDAAWEIKREMEIEGNKPGYRSEEVRKSIKGTAAAAMLQAESSGKSWARLGQALFRRSENENALKLEAGSAFEDEEELATIHITMENLIEERLRLSESLVECLRNPAETWITPDSFLSMDVEVKDEDGEALRQVITTMILLRDDVDADIASGESLSEMELNEEEIILELQRMKKNVNSIIAIAAESVGLSAAERLKEELLGKRGGEETCLLGSLDEVIDALEKKRVYAEFIAASNEEEIFANDNTSTLENSLEEDMEDVWFADAYVADVVTEEFPREDYSDKSARSPRNRSFIESEVEYTSKTFNGSSSQATNTADSEVEVIDSIEYASVELVTDDEDLDNTVMNAKDVKGVDIDENPGKEENEPFIVTLTLRTFDVVFFVIEKTVTVGIPGVFTAYRTIKINTEKVKRNGLGKEGWDLLVNANSGAKRY